MVKQLISCDNQFQSTVYSARESVHIPSINIHVPAINRMKEKGKRDLQKAIGE